MQLNVYSAIKHRTPTVGEVSLYIWSPILLVCAQLLHYIIITYFLFWKNPILLNWISINSQQPYSDSSPKHQSVFCIKYLATSVTRLGNFFWVIDSKFSCKSSPNIGLIFGLSEIHHFWLKTAGDSFWATFGKIGLLFIPASGHTACIKSSCPFTSTTDKQH